MPSSTFLQALQGRTDALGLFDIFGVAAQSLVIARVAEIVASLVVLGVGGPAAIQADHAWERQLVLDRRAKFAMALKVRSPPETAVRQSVSTSDLWAIFDIEGLWRIAFSCSG